jgi:hypothetical protein
MRRAEALMPTLMPSGRYQAAVGELTVSDRDGIGLLTAFCRVGRIALTLDREKSLTDEGPEVF